MTPHADLTPVMAHLDFLENLIQESGYEAAAAHLLSYPMSGEPVMQGRDPISGYLNDAAPPEVRVRARPDALHLQYFRSAYGEKVVATREIGLDDYPGIVGFMYCVEDLRFLELSPPQ